MKFSILLMYVTNAKTRFFEKSEGCFHSSKIMQFRHVLKKHFQMNLEKLTYAQLHDAIRKNYVCKNNLCIFCGSNYVYVIQKNWPDNFFIYWKINKNCLWKSSFRNIMKSRRTLASVKYDRLSMISNQNIFLGQNGRHRFPSKSNLFG